jgi:hypothetical protein
MSDDLIAVLLSLPAYASMSRLDPDEGPCVYPSARGALTMRTVFLALSLIWFVDTPAAAPLPDACSAAEYHQFDFWLGDWDAFEADDTSHAIARTHVDRIAAGCAIHELYEQTDGLIGDSILSFDAVRKEWQQTWVTNRGSLMVISGAFNEGTVTLDGEAHLRDGRAVLQRITWKADSGGVRESSVTSKDGGKTWVPAFDVMFRKHQ